MPGFRCESRGDRATTWMERGVAADRNRNARKSIVREADGRSTSSKETVQNKAIISFIIVLEKLIKSLQCLILFMVKLN